MPKASHSSTKGRRQIPERCGRLSLQMLLRPGYVGISSGQREEFSKSRIPGFGPLIVLLSLRDQEAEETAASLEAKGRSLSCPRRRRENIQKMDRAATASTGPMRTAAHSLCGAMLFETLY